MEELWRDVVGYEGLYQVSNLGRVRSLDRIVSNNWGNGPRLIKGRIRKQSLRCEYWFVGLTDLNHKCNSFYVARLVARAFPEICGEWFDGCQVDHISTDKNDNTAYNLRVCTASENMRNPITMEANRQKMIDYLNKNGHPLLGKPCPEETKEKISSALKKYTDEELKQHRRDYVDKNRERHRQYWRDYKKRKKTVSNIESKGESRLNPYS